MVIYRRLEGFLDSGEVDEFSRLVQDNAGLFANTLGRVGLGPKYRVIDGNQIR